MDPFLVTGTLGMVRLFYFVPFFFNFKFNNMDYNKLFNDCVELLIWLAIKFDITYKEINVWIFIIIEPIIFFSMLFYILYLNSKLYRKAQ